MLRSNRLQKCLIDLAGDITRQQIVQQFLRWLLIDVIHGRGAELHGFTFQFGGLRTLQAHAGPARCLAHALALFFRQLLGLRNFAAADLLHGKDALDNHALRDYRLEFVEDQVNAIDLLMAVTLDDAVRQLFHGIVFDFAQQVEMFADNLDASSAFGCIRLDDREATAQKIAALAADGLNVDVLVLEIIDKLQRGLQHIGIEGARESAITSDHDDENGLLGSPAAKQGMEGQAGGGIDQFGAADRRLQNVGQHLRVGTSRQGAFLGAAQLGRRDHLHGLGDLARVLHAADTTPKIEYVGHVRLGSHRRCSLPLAGKALFEFLDGLGQVGADVVVENLLLLDRAQHAGIAGIDVGV